MLTIKNNSIALLLACALPAQVVTVQNSGGAVATWTRLAVDVKPPHPAGKVGATRYVLGPQLAPGLWSLDLWAHLAAGESRTVDLADAVAEAFTLGPLPDPLAHFGGWVEAGGAPMGVEALGVEGAAYVATLRARTGPLADVRLSVRWYPDTPALMFGEAIVTASNPAVPDLGQTFPDGLRVTWGDAIWCVPGALPLLPIVPAGTRLADGQAWSVPLVLGWVRHARGGDLERWVSATGLRVSATQATALYHGGNPRLPAGFDGAAWSVQNHPKALAALHSWAQPPVGPNRVSGDTGAQEDQWCIGSEPLQSPAAVQVRYLSALALSHRPCHHLHADGRQRDPSDTPKVMFWDGRPHPATGNLLGKPRTITPDETHGWWGPDDEHWLYNTLFAAYRLTGSPALQREIEQQARLYLFQKTVPSQNPGWFTSGGGAARSIGWECLLAVHLHRNLRDRALAARVADRWRARWTECWAPSLGREPGRLGWWDVRRDDPRLGTGDWAITWQCAVGAAFLDYAGEYFGVPAARELALEQARIVVEQGWTLRDGRWKSWAQQPLEGTLPPPDESFNYFGNCLAPWVIHDREGAAADLWQWLVANATEAKQTAWLPPTGPSGS
jgi:hypothetical protein